MRSFEAIFKEGLPTPDNSLITLYLESVNLSSQVHIFHLLTRSEAEHESLGDFYSGLTDISDELAEGVLALNVDLSNWDNSVFENNLVFIYSKQMLMDSLDGFRQNVTDSIDFTSSSGLSGINDTLINMQKCVDKLLYKLKLQ